MGPLGIALPLAGFLSGSVPWSYIVARSRGVDLRRTGSGNVGATNLLRTCGKAAGAAGLLLDALKGAIPALAALLLTRDDLVTAAAAVAAVLGHVFSPWLGFRGGKGVATALGGVAVMAPLPLLAALAVFGAVLAVRRYVSLASVSAAVALAAASLILPCGTPGRAACILIAALLVARHAGNIRRILSGTERRLGDAR